MALSGYFNIVACQLPSEGSLGSTGYWSAFAMRNPAKLIPWRVSERFKVSSRFCVRATIIYPGQCLAAPPPAMAPPLRHTDTAMTIELVVC
ncbi:hypothetical protein ACFX15_009818 [Malus domestica]